MASGQRQSHLDAEREGFPLNVAAPSQDLATPRRSGRSNGDLVLRQASTTTSQAADPSCTNGPNTRACWGNGYSIATNYDSNWPVTGVTRSYSLEITNQTLAPDGFSRIVLGVNGGVPGPTIWANWGDTLSITVTNKLTDNGTSIHWHGLRQRHTNQMDGTNGLTECPLAPGETKTYTFLCTQFGTSWYHSHHSAQYGDGVLGTIIIYGPATSNYDIDLGTFPIGDWYHETAYVWSWRTSHGSAIPAGDTVLINGTQVSSFGGKYAQTTLAKGKKHRLRLINTSLDNNFKVHLEGHSFTVITADFVPIVPYTTDWLFIGIGQRYDVIINANNTASNYWFRAAVQQGCGTNLNTDARSVFSYSGAPSSNPNDTVSALPAASCTDESNLVPYVKLNVPTTIIPQSSVLDVGFAGFNVTQDNGQASLIQWNLNLTAQRVDWEKPTLQYVIDGNTSYPRNLNLIEIPTANSWSYWVIQELANSAPAIPHPIHLHGHDFYVLGTGTGIFSDSSTLNYNNPPRRDVAMLPAGGYLVMAFITDNPGAWLMHCHIAWHVGEGLGAQFLERSSDILSTLNIGSDFKQTCDQWKSFANQPAPWPQDDSGLRRKARM